MNETQGWINLYKPLNLSSAAALNKIKKNFKFKKLGYAGTLDPLAKGILPIAIGKTTKLIPYMNDCIKTYKFTITWGTQTTTDDKEGDILYKSSVIPNYTEIHSKLKNFVGLISQVPPKASAVKIKGKRAYKLFREKKEFKINPKFVIVKSINIINHSNNNTSFQIECGKGFYIRSLGRDLSQELGTYGHISHLERLKVGKFTVKSSILLDDLIKISQTHSEINCIQPSISMLDDILAYEIEGEKDLDNISLGRSINIDETKIKKLSSTIKDEKTIFLSNKGNVVSIGKLIGNLFKPNKVLI